MDRRILAIAAAAVLSTAGAMGGETHTGYGVTLVSGYDSNPLRVSKEGSGPDGYFGQLRLDGQVSHAAASSLTLFVDGEVRGRFHESATSDADSSILSASIAALTTLWGLVVPRILVSTSLMPAASTTARTAPPAMTPVPGLAGRSST